MKDRRRLRTSDAVNTMRVLIQSEDCRWHLLCSIATFRAEEIRAATQPPDMCASLRGFERNPFRWNVPEGWLSHAAVAFLWTWRCGFEKIQYAFVTARLNNIFDRKHMPFPPGMSQRDADMYQRLHRAAEIEEQESKAPCVYLGLEIEPGRFEPDPANSSHPQQELRKRVL